VQDGEVGDHHVERVVGELQVLGVAVDELDRRVQRPGQRHHRGRDVHPDCRRAAGERGGGDVTRPAAHVEYPASGADGGCIEEWLDDLSGDRQQQPMIGGRPLLPAGGLERVEGIRIDLRTHRDLPVWMS
jgi:hypothetical protein